MNFLPVIAFFEEWIFLDLQIQNYFISTIISLIEKTITLESIPLLDFLGIENRNINELSQAFPKSRIISRGNEILVRGETPDILQITEILHSLQEHFHQFGRITEENVRGYISQERQDYTPEDSVDGIIL